MAVREVWFGSVGPYIFDDTSQWPDGEDMVGARIPQAFIEDAPTEMEHAVRLSEMALFETTSSVNSKMSSEIAVRSVADSAITSNVSASNSGLSSKVESLVSGGGEDVSVVQSAVDSTVQTLSVADSNVKSHVDSRVGSTTSAQSTGDSEVQSALDSALQGTSVADSTLTSTTTSLAVQCSALESKNLSGVFE